MLKNCLAYILLIAVTTPIMLVFLVVAKYGTVTLYEPNRAILGGEIAVCVAIIAFGIERLAYLRSVIRRNGRGG